MDQLQEVLQMCVHISTRLNGPSGVNQETLDCPKKGFQTIFQPEKLNVWHSTKMNKKIVNAKHSRNNLPKISF